MKIWQMEITLPIIDSRNKNTMIDYLEIKFTEIGDDFLVARMPVNEKTKQPLGIMHGGASCVLAETVGSVAANFCVDQTQHYCVGLDINTNHIRAVKNGYVIGIAKPFHLGKSTQVWGIDIRDEQSNLISVNRLTMAVMQKTT